jgi:pimeloyl-ACP methyl ester carboxylesterase
MHTLVIIPGWGGSHETWANFIALASQKYQVHCIDMPCFGDTKCPDNAWGIEDYGNYLNQKLSTISSTNGKVFLLGHSFGGQVAAYTAAQNQKNLAGLILVAPAIIRSKNHIRRAVFRYLTKSGQWFFSLPLMERFQLIAKKLFYRMIGGNDYKETSGIKRQIFKKIIRQDMRYLLPSIQIPTLIVWGTHDAYTPYNEGRVIQHMLPNSKLITVRNGTHGLHLHRLDELYHAVCTFLDDIHD